MNNVSVQVDRTGTENTLSLLKRFTRKVSGSGVLRRARSLRYRQRELSYYKRKKGALRRIERRAQYEKLRKLGKVGTV